jgi:EmrB/QacA subfamily drug resistance transporter
MDRATRFHRRWWVLISVGVGTFMTALDGSVVNTVLPVIKGSLGSNVATIEWVVTIYLLVVSGLLLSFGRLGDLHGHKPLYILGFGVFVIASALCGLAPTAPVLIAFRVLQALGAAMLLANSAAILTGNFPPQQRGQALGLQATMTYLGLTAGPALGGWLTSRLTWRAIFYLNVPVGLLALALSLHFIPRDVSLELDEPFDWPGAAVWISGLAALLLVLNQGHSWGWRSPGIVSLSTAAGLLLAAFVMIEERAHSPMLDLSLFRSRTFSAATLSAVLNYICIYTVVFLLPFYLIEGRGLSPARTGLLLTAQSLVRALAAPFSGTLSDRVGTRWPSVLGMGILTLGLFLLSRLGAQSPMSAVGVGLMVVGLGAGIFVSPNTSALMGSAPRHRQGIAAATMATARNLGMVLGVGIAGATFTTVLSRAPARSAALLIAAVDVGFLVAVGAGALGVLATAAGGSDDRKRMRYNGAPA